MAVVEDRKDSLEGKKAILEAKLHICEARLAGEEDENVMDLDDVPEKKEEIPAYLKKVQFEIAQIDDAIQEEVHRRERWHIENERRRFNYLPFAFAFLKVLAKKGKLDELVEKAKKKQADRAAARKKSE